MSHSPPPPPLTHIRGFRHSSCIDRIGRHEGKRTERMKCNRIASHLVHNVAAKSTKLLLGAEIRVRKK